MNEQLNSETFTKAHVEVLIQLAIIEKKCIELEQHNTIQKKNYNNLKEKNELYGNLINVFYKELAKYCDKNNITHTEFIKNWNEIIQYLKEDNNQ